MSTTLPRIPVAFMGMERIVARLEEHDVLFRLLARGAAAQKMAGYVSYIGGPAAADHTDGPEGFHLVIIDNGRSKILADPRFREMLCCIRCAACLNVCPVYGVIGGHAYGYPYSGPVGAVVTPLLVGVNRAKDLCLGETLCGACKDACPVDIDLPRMLLELRAMLAGGDSHWHVAPHSFLEAGALRAWSTAVQNETLYRIGMRTAAALQRMTGRLEPVLQRMPVLKGWAASRELPELAPVSFLDRWRRGDI